MRYQDTLVQGLALTDPLTGLLNRRGFDGEMQRIRNAGLAGCTLHAAATAVTAAAATTAVSAASDMRQFRAVAFCALIAFAHQWQQREEQQ
jgi:GGDEF domain-containing protein